MRFLGSYWLELDNFMMGICLLAGLAGLAGLLRRDAGSSIPEDVHLIGTVATETEQRGLFLAIQQIAQSAKCDMPRMSSLVSIQQRSAPRAGYVSMGPC